MDWREGTLRSLSRWTTMLVAVCAAHAGISAYALWVRSNPEDDDLEGVFVIELAAMTTSAHTAVPADTPGPEREEAVDARPAALVEKTIKEQILDLPPLPTMPTVPPDLVLPERIAEKPPEREEQEDDLPRQKVIVAASEASIASRPLKLDEAAASAKTAAPMTGLSRQDARTRAKWQREVVAHLGRFKNYPPISRDRGEAGQIMLKFDLDRSGRVTNASVHRASGYVRLDAAALEMLKRASPLPPPPDEMPGLKIELLVPVQFHIKN